MKFEIKSQDLMSVESKYVICHCISADCAMGKGIVVPVTKKYIGVKEACKKFVKNIGENIAVGHAFRYVCEAGVVYNLFSKRIFRHKAGYGITIEQYHKQLKNCLNDMKNQMLANGERFLAMPKIACGLDKCQWIDIEQIIKNVFENTDLEILVCVI